MSRGYAAKESSASNLSTRAAAGPGDRVGAGGRPPAASLHPSPAASLHPPPAARRRVPAGGSFFDLLRRFARMAQRRWGTTRVSWAAVSATTAPDSPPRHRRGFQGAGGETQCTKIGSSILEPVLEPMNSESAPRPRPIRPRAATGKFAAGLRPRPAAVGFARGTATQRLFRRAVMNRTNVVHT